MSLYGHHRYTDDFVSHQANVRLGRLVGLWVGYPLSGSPACPCTRLLEHLVRQHEKVRGYRDPKGLRRLEVDN